MSFLENESKNESQKSSFFSVCSINCIPKKEKVNEFQVNYQIKSGTVKPSTLKIAGYKMFLQQVLFY